MQPLSTFMHKLKPVRRRSRYLTPGPAYSVRKISTNGRFLQLLKLYLPSRKMYPSFSLQNERDTHSKEWHSKAGQWHLPWTGPCVRNMTGKGREWAVHCGTITS